MYWSGLYNPLVKNALRYRMDAHEDYEEILKSARVAESEALHRSLLNLR